MSGTLIDLRDPEFWRNGVAHRAAYKRERDAARKAHNAMLGKAEAAAMSLLEEIAGLMNGAPRVVLSARLVCQVCGGGLTVKPPHCSCGEEPDWEVEAAAWEEPLAELDAWDQPVGEEDIDWS